MLNEMYKASFATMQPVFERHDVPEADRMFLFLAFDRMLEEDIDHEQVVDAIEKAILSADSYEELLQQFGRGHRRNRAWFSSMLCENAKPTKKARALLRDLAAVDTFWRAPAPLDMGGR